MIQTVKKPTIEYQEDESTGALEILDETLCNEINSGSIEKIDILLQNGANIHTCKCHVSPIYFALKLQKFGIVDHLLKKGAHFEAVQTTGPFAEFTALHHALLNDDTNVAYRLLRKYKVDPTVKAADGVQPIQLAVLRRHYGPAFRILDTDVSIETELYYSLFKKYAKENCQWNYNFGDKMTLFTYAIFNDNYIHTKIDKFQSKFFFDYNPNCLIRDKNNKTLLMYAFENCLFHLASGMMPQYSGQEINASDNTGNTALHYLVNAECHEDYESRESTEISKSCLLLCVKKKYGFDINVMVKNDPKTLPVHIAAARKYADVMGVLLASQHFFLPLVRPLFYAIQDEIINLSNGVQLIDQSYKSLDNPRILKVVEVIIEDIYRKNICKYPVHKEEIKLMEHLVKNEIIVCEFFETLEPKYKEIFSALKKTEMTFGSEKISIYNILMSSQKKYFQVAKDDDYNFDDHYPHMFFRSYDLDVSVLMEMIDNRLCITKKRVNILKKWEKVAYHVIKSLLLPYECVLYIVECMTNIDLENFIEAYSITIN